MGTFGTMESEDAILNRGRRSKFGCDVGHRGGVLPDFANGGGGFDC